MTVACNLSLFSGFVIQERRTPLPIDRKVPTIDDVTRQIPNGPITAAQRPRPFSAYISGRCSDHTINSYRLRRVRLAYRGEGRTRSPHRATAWNYGSCSHWRRTQGGPKENRSYPGISDATHARKNEDISRDVFLLEQVYTAFFQSSGSAPRHELGKAPFKWNRERTQAFDTLKVRCLTDPGAIRHRGSAFGSETFLYRHRLHSDGTAQIPCLSMGSWSRSILITNPSQLSSHAQMLRREFFAGCWSFKPITLESFM
ncbi:unnamed protein product [Haemonchus placei]|uniref:Uncharacterized protein n=1 Tax=Haemonchus placei TaxID=6290 RepID=A0A0N4WWY3_HAEPC|nr:unnamed protein product [Haemonchus placei]